MAWKQKGGRSDLGLVCFKNGGRNSSSCNLFDEMSACELRSPSHILEVTIHQAYYPITEDILHLLFSLFGEVQYVQVLGGSDHVLARVVYQSKHQVAEVFGELHGRCVYTGCCQMEIKWGFFEETEVFVVTNISETTASFPSTQYPSATTDISTLDDFNSEKKPVEGDSSGEHTMPTTTASIGIGVPCKPGVALYVGDGNTTISSLLTSLHALSAPTIGEEVINDVHMAAAALQASYVVLGDVVDDAPANCSAKCSCANVGINNIDELGSEKLLMKANALEEHSEAIVPMAVVGDTIFAYPLIAVSDVVDCDVDDELLVPTVMTIAKVVVPGPNLIDVASSVDCSVPCVVNIAMHINCSTKCAVCVAGVLTTVSIFDMVPMSSLTHILLDNVTWGPATTSLEILEKVCGSIVPGNRESMVMLWPWVVEKVWKQTWPLPLQFKMMIDGSDKLPWPYPSCRGCRCVQPAMVEIKAYILMTSGSKHCDLLEQLEIVNSGRCF